MPTCLRSDPDRETGSLEYSSSRFARGSRSRCWSRRPPLGHALLALLAGFIACRPLQAQIVETYTFDTFSGQPSLSIPDGNAAGVSDPRSVASAFPAIASVQVTLDIAAEFNGDLYAYLVHDTALAVLVNRPGRSASLPAGYPDSGMNLTLDAAAANDLHTYRDQTIPAGGQPLTGPWQPDGRAVDPSVVLDSTSRTAGLGLFNGMDPSGSWTLFLADMQSGGTSAINSWSLQISVVPEPAASTLAVGMALLAGCLWSRRRKTGR